MTSSYADRTTKAHSGPGHLRRRIAADCSLILVLGALLGACGGVSPKLAGVLRASTTSSPTTTMAPPRSTTAQVDLFFTRGTALGAAHLREPISSIRYSTLRSLFAGPDGAETAAGLSTVILAGSVLEGLSFSGGLAYVDTNAQFFAATSTSGLTLRLAQVVYTLTAPARVNKVQFYLHGATLPNMDGVPTSRPLTRADLAGAVDGYLLESPAVGDTVTSPVTISGLSELAGTMQIQLVGSGGTVVLDTIATTAVGETFKYTYPFSITGAGNATIRVYAAPSHARSSQLVATIPVTLAG